MLAMELLEIDDPFKYKRKIIAVSETDRCLPDVIELVVGCRLGNRTLKFRDWGKMSASFLDLTRNRAFRVAARESVEAEAVKHFKNLERDQALNEAYKTFDIDRLAHWHPVVLSFLPEDLPGYHAPRVICSQCGEGISLRREVRRNHQILCRACAGEAYWQPVILRKKA
jgi:formylmethanofuran dehydrogenase subunit E